LLSLLLSPVGLLPPRAVLPESIVKLFFILPSAIITSGSPHPPPPFAPAVHGDSIVAMLLLNPRPM